MGNKEIKAVISNKFSKVVWIALSFYLAVVVILIVMGFTVGSVNASGSYWLKGVYIVYDGAGWFGIPFTRIERYKETGAFLASRSYPGNIVLFIFILLLFALLPVAVMFIVKRRRKLINFTAFDKELVGSYTGFIPISKITLNMPIEKVDNIAAVKNFLYFYTGKTIRIGSASGVIKIRYVINADEVVAFISEAIEKAKNKREQAISQQNSTPQTDIADSLKKLAELRDSGIITEEEFNQKKSELLSKM